MISTHLWNWREFFFLAAAGAFSAGAFQALSIPVVPRTELYNYKELKQRGLLILKSAEWERAEEAAGIAGIRATGS